MTLADKSRVKHKTLLDYDDGRKWMVARPSDVENSCKKLLRVSYYAFHGSFWGGESLVF